MDIFVRSYLVVANNFRRNFLHTFAYMYLEKYREEFNLERFLRKVLGPNPIERAGCGLFLTISVSSYTLKTVENCVGQISQDTPL